MTMDHEETHFASAHRAGPENLSLEARAAAENPVMDALLENVGGLLAILNSDRQILSINDCLLDEFGIADAHDVLGMRLGEIAGCIHSGVMPAGCGTSEFCSTCGAAIAMVTAQETAQPAEQHCNMSATRKGEDLDLSFRVRACPFTYGELSFILLFMQDISVTQRWARVTR